MIEADVDEPRRAGGVRRAPGLEERAAAAESGRAEAERRHTQAGMAESMIAQRSFSRFASLRAGGLPRQSAAPFRLTRIVR